MRRILLIAVAIAFFALASAASARTYTVTSTAYCLRGTMANGQSVQMGAVANNFLRLGTKIRLQRPVMGRTAFTVMDRIGWGTQLDFWMPSCGQAMSYGRRMATFSV